MKKIWVGAVSVVLGLAVLTGCGAEKLGVAPSVTSDDHEYVMIDNATLVEEGGRQFVEISMTVWKDFPSPLVYDVVAEGDKAVKQNVPTDISGAEAGGRTLRVPSEASFAGGKIVFHLLERPASAPASSPAAE